MRDNEYSGGRGAPSRPAACCVSRLPGLAAMPTIPQVPRPTLFRVHLAAPECSNSRQNSQTSGSDGAAEVPPVGCTIPRATGTRARSSWSGGLLDTTSFPLRPISDRHGAEIERAAAVRRKRSGVGSMPRRLSDRELGGPNRPHFAPARAGARFMFVDTEV
jgi:hypothetical protein